LEAGTRTAAGHLIALNRRRERGYCYSAMIWQTAMEQGGC
jgi:hypothetical protein